VSEAHSRQTALRKAARKEAALRDRGHHNDYALDGKLRPKRMSPAAAALVYHREQLQIARLIARWIKKRRFCPKVEDILLKKKLWPEKALRNHLADMVAYGHIRYVGAGGIDLTGKGWELTPYEPEKAKLPSDDIRRGEIKRKIYQGEKLKRAIA
jgi:hypothetical protein